MILEEYGKVAPTKTINGIHAPDWLCSDKSLCTDESQNQSIPIPSEAFSYEYRQILEQYQLIDLLGFQAYMDGPVES